MDILFIADPLDRFKIYKDTTYAMMAEAARRGHVLYACEPQHLAWAGDGVEAGARRIAIVGDEANSDRSPWYAAEQPEHLPLTHFDAVLMRKDPPFDMEYVNSTWLLEMAERARRARVQQAAGDPRSLREARDRRMAAIRRADARHARRSPSARLPRRTRRRDPEAARRHGRHGRVPREAGRHEPGLDHRNAERGRRALGDGAEVHPANHRRRQAHPADRRPAGAVFARANSAGNRSARQSGRGRAWPCAAAFRA